jgi:hypothetical protein
MSIERYINEHHFFSTVAKQEKKPKKVDVKGSKDNDKDDDKAPRNMTDKERVAKGQILARILIEVLGAPKEHVEDAIKLVVDKVRQIDKATVISENTYEAEEKANKLFSTFSELEIWFDNLDILELFVFEYTPSSVEVIRPDSISLKNRVISGFFNDFLLKMHDLGLKMTDTAAKVSVARNNADALVRNFINYALEPPKSAEELSKILGIPLDNTKAILAAFEKAGVVVQKDGLFSKKKR